LAIHNTVEGGHVLGGLPRRLLVDLERSQFRGRRQHLFQNPALIWRTGAAVRSGVDVHDPHDSRLQKTDQLKFEEFSKAQAKSAVAGSEADWKAEAVEAAESYLDTSHFSKKSLINQLEFEGFTSSQAEHGAEQAGL
jgi:hypothetical protein